MALRFRSVLRQGANKFGLDVHPLSKSPSHNALGLRSIKINTIIDVGANAGQFARYARQIKPEARIFCFEPLPKPFAQLRAWANSQKGSVSVFNYALGQSEGTVEMFEHLEHTPSSSLLRSTAVSHSLYPFSQRQTPVQVNISTLDAFIRRGAITLSPKF